MAQSGFTPRWSRRALIFRSSALFSLKGVSAVWPYGIAALCVVLLIVGAVAVILLSFDLPDEPRP